MPRFKNKLGHEIEHTWEEINQMYADMRKQDTNVLIIPNRIEDNHYFLVED